MNDKTEKRRRRAKFLQKLLNKIINGEYTHYMVDLEKQYPMHQSSRKEYRHPSNWGGYNYGYMTSGESGQMAAGNKDPDI